MNTKRMFLKGALGGAAMGPVLAGAAQSRANPGEHYFPNTVLETHLGKQLRFYDHIVKGNKVVVFNMIYTACQNICPPNTANLMQVQKMLGERMGRDIFFYSLTLQPEIDRPADLQAYVKRYGITSGWTFLTGKRKDMEEIRRKLGFFDRDPEVDARLSQHTGMVRIGNDALDRWQMMPSLLTPPQLVNSIVSMAG
jgi:protein SCO1/2